LWKLWIFSSVVASHPLARHRHRVLREWSSLTYFSKPFCCVFFENPASAGGAKGSIVSSIMSGMMGRPRPRVVVAVEMWEEDFVDEERVDLDEDEVAGAFEEDTVPMKKGHTVPLRLRCSSLSEREKNQWGVGGQGKDEQRIIRRVPLV